MVTRRRLHGYTEMSLWLRRAVFFVTDWLAAGRSQVEVVEGSLQCPESGREFPISRGVPNMLLNEDEV